MFIPLIKQILYHMWDITDLQRSDRVGFLMVCYLEESILYKQKVLCMNMFIGKIGVWILNQIPGVKGIGYFSFV